MSEFSFEIDDLDLEGTTKVELIHPQSGEPFVCHKGEPFYLMVRSAKSDIVQRKIHRAQGKYAKLAQKNTGPDKGRLTYDQSQALVAEIRAAVLADWRIGKGQGKPVLDVPCTPENAIKWCLANRNTLAEQIANGSDDLSRFEKDTTADFTETASDDSSKGSAAK